MKKEICIELRQKIVKAHKNSSGYKSISNQFDILKTTVQSIIQRFKKFNIVQNLTGRGRNEKLSPRPARQVGQEIAKSPRITGKVLLQNLRMERIEISKSTLQRTLKKEHQNWNLTTRYSLVSYQDTVSLSYPSPVCVCFLFTLFFWKIEKIKIFPSDNWYFGIWEVKMVII